MKLIHFPPPQIGFTVAAILVNFNGRSWMQEMLEKDLMDQSESVSYGARRIMWIRIEIPWWIWFYEPFQMYRRYAVPFYTKFSRNFLFTNFFVFWWQRINFSLKMTTWIGHLPALRELGLEKEHEKAYVKKMMLRGVSKLESIIDGGDYCLGDSLTMADLFFVPQMRNVVDRFGIDISGILTLRPQMTRVSLTNCQTLF